MLRHNDEAYVKGKGPRKRRKDTKKTLVEGREVEESVASRKREEMRRFCRKGMYSVQEGNRQGKEEDGAIFGTNAEAERIAVQ